ncbi:MAG: hypothetical protein J1F66_03970, partial [Clostridiales bacterium]|nr:hypothetical protein [Clostridiales bacterium]
MPKVKIVCLILATVLASVGTLLFLSNLGGGEIPPLDVPSDDINTYLDKPIDATPSDVEDVRENLFIAHKALLMREGFYGVSEGSTTSFGISQQVLNTRYVIGEFGNKNSFKQMVTKGVVPNAYQLYMWGDNYLYRGFDKVNALDDVSWKGAASKLNEDDFYNKFGHRSDKLTAYILNYDTVTSGVLENFEDGLYTYRFALDTIDATAYMRTEMVTNGNLSGYPTFSKAEIVVTMDEEWTVKTLTTDCKYTAKTMGISASCSEDITETFYYDYEGDLPEKDFFEQFFDADYSDVGSEKGALDVLLDIFSPYLNGEDLQVALSVNGGDVAYVNALVSIAGLDIADLSKLSVSARLGDALNVAYEHGQGKIYLKYQDFQASTTVDGILGLVGTLLPLLGDEGGLDFDGLLGDFDLDGLLESLTYEISDDETECTVSLPLSLAGLDIYAKLYADVDGENYILTNAVITLGDIEITIKPQAWDVEERIGDYPEILGLFDLIQNGKIALNAQLALQFGGVDYDIDAEVLVDLATLNVALNADLGNNGSVSAVLVDKVVYVQYGEVKVKLDISNIGNLIAFIEQLTGSSLEMDIPEVSVGDILGLLSTITATGVEDGTVALNLSVGGLNCAVYLAPQDGSWHLTGIAVDFDGINAVIAPSENFADVTKPADADQYADVTPSVGGSLVDTFIEPIINLINGESYGVEFSLNLAIGSNKTYTIQGNVAYDANKNLHVVAAISNGDALIVDAEVIYANGTVYLTLNGIRAAFAVSGNGNVDIAKVLAQLQGNEQIASLINSNETLRELIAKINEIAEVMGGFELSSLLDVDFTEVITGFVFNDGKLSLSLDAGALGFNGISADITLANDNGNLTVTLDNLHIASIDIALSATVTTDVETVEEPNAADYILNLQGKVKFNGITVALELSVDTLNLDVWATAKIGEQTVYLRYLDNVIYVKYGNVALKLDTTNLDGVISKITGLLGSDVPSLDSIDLEKILSALKIDLTDASLLVTITLGDVKSTIQPNDREAEQLDINGEFVDGIALIETFFDPILNVINGKSFGISFGLNLTVGAKTYSIEGSVAYDANKTLCVIATVSEGDTCLINAKVIYANSTIYLEVNGIRAAFAVSGGSDFDLTKLLARLTEDERISSFLEQHTTLKDVVDGIFELIEKIEGFDVSKLLNVDFSEILTKLTFKDGKLSLSLDASELGFNGVSADITLANDNSNLVVTVDGLQIANLGI